MRTPRSDSNTTVLFADLKALSNAGWNVESENKTTDDGHTHIKSVHANIEGRYDVDGGKGQFAAVDHHKEAVTEYHDENSSLKRNETASNTAAREHVVRKTDDGTQISSTTSSSTSSSKFQQMSSTKHESVPYLTNDDYDLRRYDTNRNEDASSVTRKQITKTNDYEQNLRNNDYEQNLRKNDYQQNVRKDDYQQHVIKDDYQTVRKNEYEHSVRKNDYEQNVTRSDYETGELVSRKIDYPDDNTRVIVETRCLPDGTRVTSTKREFRAPVQSTRSEQSYQTRENKSYSTQVRSDARESSKIIRQVVDDRATDIVDSQRNVDDYDFKRQIAEYTTKDNDDYSDVQRHDRTVNKTVVDHSKADDDYSHTTRHVTRVNKVIESSNKDDYVQTHHRKYDTTNFRRDTGTPHDKVTPRDSRTETKMPRESRPETFTPRNERPEAKTPGYDRPEKTPRDARPDGYTPRNERPSTYTPRGEHPDTYTPRNERPDTKAPGNDRPERPDDYTPRSERPDTFTPRGGRPDAYSPGKERPDTCTPGHERPGTFIPHSERPDTDKPHDERPGQQNDYVPQQTRHTEEKVHHVTRDKKVEETVEKKTRTDHYQTTYQADFPQKKISNDWSPSHQAWASTLRADTPTTTRPSTRASSPGSRTFKSSTSSLRSSVSPDKTSRKPSSRGGSPNKIDRYSPTRTVSDKQSTTSTHSVTEVKTHKYSSPDDKRPPTGRSPTRPGYSPERKPQDHRQRPSASPEKRPQNLPFRPSASPDRKPTQKGSPTDQYPSPTSPTRPLNRGESPTRPRASPERKPTQHSSPSSGFPRTTPDRNTDGVPKNTSMKPGQSPERKPGFEKPNEGRPSPTSEFPRTTSPTRPYQPTDITKRPATSPDRKPGYQPTSPDSGRPDKPTDKQPQDDTPKRGSVSPDRKPGYMRPTSTNKPSDSLKSPIKPSDKTSPTKCAPSQSPERKPQDHTKTTTKVQADHYKFIDEETKMYTRPDTTESYYPMSSPSGPEHISPRDKDTSPTRKSPSKDSPDFPRKRSPSPKEHVTFIDQRDRIDTTHVKTTDFTEEITTHRSPKDKDSPTDKTGHREPSPSKYGTYDKKKPYDRDVTEDTTTTTTTKDTKDDKFDSLTRHEKSPKKTPDQPSSPIKKIPRDSVSPVKSHSKDTKFKHTTDFISTERTTEEVNKKTTKDHPRKLVTPSSSPTRKSKPTDTEPSTGQSSPTTSVSGFVYFSSPRTEKTVVTNLDDQEYHSETYSIDETVTSHKRPESLDVNRSQSPTKIPCRSPSPEKRVSPTKDSLPRKSSLKKPTTEITQASPIEKPPSSFRISPTDEKKGLPDHKVIKKDRPEGPGSDAPVVKQKPPLERRETYEDRCRKILGMMDDITTTETTKKTTLLKEPETNLSSPSVSPCHSPVPRETPFEYPTVKKTTDKKTDVTDFITREQENIVKTFTTVRDDALANKKPKTSRESSPTKLQDITKEKTILKHDTETKDTEDIKKTVTTKYPSPRQSPERKPSYQPSEGNDTPKSRESPERTPKENSEHPHATSPSNRLPSGTSPRSSLSPERKPNYEPTEKKPENKHPEESSLLTPGYMKSTSAVSSKYDTTTVDTTVTTKTTDKKPSRSSESPTRKTTSDKPLKPGQPSDKSPQRKPSFEQTAPTKSSPEKKPIDKFPRETSPSRPGYTKTTTSMVVEYDSSSTTEDLEDITTIKTPKTRPSTRTSGSPTRQVPKPSDGPTGRTYPSHKSPERKPSKPKDSSPTRPGYMKTTASMTSKFETTSTEDLHETNLTSETVQIRRTPRPFDSPTRKTSKPSDDSRPRLTHPTDQSPDRLPHSRGQPSPTRSSPEKMPDDKYLRDASSANEKPDKIPNYMKTTSSVSSKYDIVSATDDVEETTSFKTTEIRHSQRPSGSPTRKISQPEDSPRRTSPSRSTQQTDKSPQRKPKDETAPKRASPEKQPVDKYRKEPSPTRQTPSSEKTPGFMKTTSSQVYKQDAVTATKDFLETCKMEIVEMNHPSRPSDSPTRKSSKPSEKHEPEADASRTVSPARSQPSENIPSRKSVSPDRKPGHQQPSEPLGRKPTDKHPRETSPSKQTISPDTPGYMRTTTSVSTREDTTEVYEDDTSVKTVQSRYPSTRPSALPAQKIPKPDDAPNKPHLDRSPNRLPRYEETSPRPSPERQTRDKYPKETSPSRKTPTSDEMEPTYSKSITSVRATYDSALEDIQKTKKSKVTETHYYNSSSSGTSPTRKAPKPADGSKSAPEQPRTQSPSKYQPDDSMKKPSGPKDTPTKKPAQKYPQESSPTRPSSSPDRKPGYMRPTASVTSKFETTTTCEEFETTEDVIQERPSPRLSESPSRRTPHEPSKTKPGYLQQPEEPRQLRTPSPVKKTTKDTEVSTDFLISEREQEILDRVQKSLRRLSPERKEKSPSRERSPGKTTTSLQDIDITSHTEIDDDSLTDYVTETTEKISTSKITSRPEKPKDEKPKDQKVPSKLNTRTVSPTKKPSGIATPTKLDKSPDSPTKTRSISPKKPIAPTERPQSPQISKPSGIKPKEQIPSHLTRKPTPATLNVTKVEKTTTDLKKTTNISSVTKQNSFTRTTTASRTPTKSIQSPTGRPSEPESKRTPTPKGIREGVIPAKKDSDTKVTRTVSDINIKSKKTSPQRMKSKPEITVSDVSTKTTTKTTTKPHSKLPSKPKSATTLNTSTDEDDIIVDVQQSKSSRENSPDRICPTPVNFGEDVGTPRYPDEVSEPDDEFNRRAYHTIHEAETIVDDIVEICEDDELFVRKTDVDIVTEDDESLLSVTDKVSRFTKGVDTVTKPKDTTSTFKDTERRVHSDYIDERLKSDECLLSVSEKVNKFAKGPRDTRDSKSPSRRVTDEYDKNTVYQDDYTKLSVHDKAHLFVETAENVKTPKVKPTPQRVERPDLTNVDDSLKSDDCLLSVSDKVHKFVKTAEQYLTESHEVEEKEKKIKEQHDKIMQKIVHDAEDDEYEIETTTYTEDVEVTNDRKTPDRGHQDDKPLKPKETPSSLPKAKDYSSPNKKPTERPPTVKITTLRSSEAVKKAKALFENIATTTQKTKETTHTTTAKLTDIGVMKKSPKTDSTTVLHPSVEDGSPNITDVDSEVDAAPLTPKDRPSTGTPTRPNYPRHDKPRSSPSRLAAQSPEVPRSKSPMRQTVETTTTTKTILSRYPASPRAESPRQRPENEKPDKVPGYLRPTKTSQIKEETKVVEETEVSSRRGSGKFGVELRRTSVERSTASSERRRSVEHPCIEDIFDLDLLEQMVSNHKICMLILLIYVSILYLYFC